MDKQHNDLVFGISSSNGKRLEDSPMWMEPGKKPIPMDELSDEEIIENLRKVNGWANNHRARILKAQQAILTILKLEEQLGAILRERHGVSFVVPTYETEEVTS